MMETDTEGLLILGPIPLILGIVAVYQLRVLRVRGTVLACRNVFGTTELDLSQAKLEIRSSYHSTYQTYFAVHALEGSKEFQITWQQSPGGAQKAQDKLQALLWEPGQAGADNSDARARRLQEEHARPVQDARAPAKTDVSNAPRTPIGLFIFLGVTFGGFLLIGAIMLAYFSSL